MQLMARYGTAAEPMAFPALSQSGSVLRVEVVRDVGGFPPLRDGWNALLKASRSFSAAQSYDYALAAWRSIPDGEAELAIINIWRGERLICVWPLKVGRLGGLRVAMHLGIGDEYAGPLILEDRYTRSAATLALRAALRLADTVEIYAADPKSEFIAVARAARNIKYRSRINSPAVAVGAAPSFDEWLAGKSKSFRQGLAYERRRLAKLGGLETVTTSGDDGRQLVEWLFAGKRQLLSGRGKTDSWVFRPQSEALLKRLLADGAAGVFGSALCLDGKIIAGSVCFRSSGAIEFFMTGFDPEYAAYSPGNLLIEDLARMAASEGRDFDFRVTQDAYKMRWADTFAERETIIIAATARGAIRPVRLTLERAVRVARRAAKASAKGALAKIRRSARS